MRRSTIRKTGGISTDFDYRCETSEILMKLTLFDDKVASVIKHNPGRFNFSNSKPMFSIIVDNKS